MKTPYLITLNEGFEKDLKDVQIPPHCCRYPIHFASIRKYYQTPGFQILSQQLNHRPFFMDLVQLEVKESVDICFDIQERQLFLYFMLKGKLLYTTDQHRPIVTTNANSFLMSYYDNGRYFAHAEKGTHIALVISILPEWMEGMSRHYVNLQEMLSRFKNDVRLYNTMYQCRIDRKIQRWLYKIYSYSEPNVGVLDGNLRKYISYTLEHYNNMVEGADLAYQIKSYIENHYCEQELNVKFLCDHFFVTQRTLLNVFRRKYQISVQEFYTELRMGHAQLLMQQKGLGVKDVYMEVGYADERSFRSAMDRYLKRR